MLCRLSWNRSKSGWLLSGADDQKSLLVGCDRVIDQSPVLGSHVNQTCSHAWGYLRHEEGTTNHEQNEWCTDLQRPEWVLLCCQGSSTSRNFIPPLFAILQIPMRMLMIE